MSLLIVKATKPAADSKLGFGYRIKDDGPPVIGSIDESGLFGKSDMKEGQEILSINGTSVSGIGGGGMKALLSSLPAGEVTIALETPPSDADRAVFGFAATLEGGAVKIHGNMKTYACPPVLSDAGVPGDRWTHVHLLIVGKLLPSSVKCLQTLHDAREMERKYFSSILNDEYRRVQVKAAEASAEHGNAMLAAVAAKDRVNALLAGYGVVAALEVGAVDTFLLAGRDQGYGCTMNVATGFVFHRVDAGAGAGPPSPSAFPVSVSQSASGEQMTDE